MPAPRADIDWVAIRREWETTDVSDAVLAQRWGFKSPNSIGRKRVDEGWTRNVEAITASLVGQAMATVVRVGKRLAPKKDTHTETQQFRAMAEAAEAPVGGKGASRPPPTPPTPEETPTRPQRPPTQREARDLVETAKLNTAHDLAEIKAAAIADQLAQAYRMREIGNAWLEHLMAIATAGRGGVDPEFTYEQARQRIASINPDKDTLSSMMKAATGMIAEATKIEREALGMNTPAPPGDPGAGGPGPAVRVEDITRLFGVVGLERAALTAKEATKLRPGLTISGVAEPPERKRE